MELPKAILDRMPLQERRHWAVLKYKHETAASDMLKVQAEYCAMAHRNKHDRRLKIMADRGYKYEKLSFEAHYKLNENYFLYTKKYFF